MKYVIFVVNTKECKQTRIVRDTYKLANNLCHKLRKEGYLVTPPRPYDSNTGKTY